MFLPSSIPTAILIAVVLRLVYCMYVLFSEVDKRVVSKRVVLADFPPERKPERGYIRMFSRNEKPERGYIRMFPRNENRNEGTFAKATLYKTALLSPSDLDCDTLHRLSAFCRYEITLPGLSLEGQSCLRNLKASQQSVD